MEQYAAQIQNELRALGDPARQESTRRFFKEAIMSHGVPAAQVKKIARQTCKLLRSTPKEQAFQLCEALWQSGHLEEGGVACEVAYALRDQYVPEDFAVFERWVDSYVANWAACDTLCNHTVGTFVQMYPETVQALLGWTKSPNRWKQRAAAVTLIIPARQGLFLQEAFAIADRLIASKDDLVQKGYGWLLKAASEAHPDAVFAYLMVNKQRMPRTAFRYALEKMSKEKRAEAMQRPV